MTDPADRFLEERLHAVARAVAVPVVPPEEDVRRGRRRLVRLRVAMAGATTGTLAVVLGITGLTAGAPKATELPPVTEPPSVLPATPSSSPSADPGGDDAETSDHAGRGAGTPVGGAPAVGPGTTTADSGGVPPEKSQVKHAPTEAATGAGPHHLTPPGADPTDDPTPVSTVTPSVLPTVLPTALPTEDPTTSPTDPDTGTPTEPPTSPPPTEPPPPVGDDTIRVNRVLGYFNRVLSSRLDPPRDHLQPFDRTVDPKVTRWSEDRLFALGATYRWQDGHTVSGLGVTVASGWDQVDWECGATYSDWDCHLVESEAGRTEVATHDGLRQVSVEHSDGRVVVVTAEGLDSAETALVAAAGDGRLDLPGTAPLAPPTIDSDVFASAGQDVLLGDDATFDQASLDRSPSVRGTWSADGTDGGTLAWSARPTYGGAAFTCLTTYRSCSSVVVDTAGTTVHLALLKARAGGGWVVEYDGPSYAVRVLSSDRTLPKKRGYAFVTDHDWQPVR